MDGLTAAAQWLHVFFGIFWFGGTLYATFVVLPAMSRLPPLNARAMSMELQRQIPRVIPAVALATILLGFVRGTALGPIRSTADLSSPYGVWWLVGLVGAVALVFWGQYVITPAGRSALRPGRASGSPVRNEASRSRVPPPADAGREGLRHVPGALIG